MSLPAIELYDPDVYATGVPHEQFRWLREHAPLYWHTHPDGAGFWLVSRHADVVAVSRSDSGAWRRQPPVLIARLAHSPWTARDAGHSSTAR